MAESLQSTVIKYDFCTGCGVCNAIEPSIEIKPDQFGMLKAFPRKETHESEEKLLKVCPFSSSARDEDEISEDIFGHIKNKNEATGKYIKNYVGHAIEGEYRIKGSSGGGGKWILDQLILLDKVDYVIQVVSAVEAGELFTYQVFKKGDLVINGSKSAYYPITLTNSLEFIKSNEGRYAITAIPCFSKALRNLADENIVYKERIKFIIGIICGHLKSPAFAELLGWQVGVKPKLLKEIEFRGKLEGKKANDKGVFAIDIDNKQSPTKSSKELFGGNWGHGFFKYKGCDFCDDVVGETSDVSVGDAWLEDYMEDHLGNNVLVVRNQEILEIIEEGIEKNKLMLTEVSPETVKTSQLGGFRHRREGLSYRLHLHRKSWLPKKRVKKGRNLSLRRQWMFKVREEIRDASHEYFKLAKERDDLKYFLSEMNPLVKKLNRPPFSTRLYLKLISFFKK
jgi:coenzyme F420 hydrogenase subunit beta